MLSPESYLHDEQVWPLQFDRNGCSMPPIRIYHNGPRRIGDYHYRVTQYPLTPAMMLPPSSPLYQTVSQAARLAMNILSSDPGIQALSSLARALYALSPEDVRVIDPRAVECECCARLAPETLSTSIVHNNLRQVGVQNAQQMPCAPELTVPMDEVCHSWFEQGGQRAPETWDRRAAKQYVALISAEWPDVLIDETLQWPTNFANVERRPWGKVDHDDSGFMPHKFLVSLNAPRIHSMHECGPEDMCRYMFQLVVTMVHEVGGHLFVTYLTRGRAHTPRAMRHPNYFPTIYERAPESGRFLELALFGGALVFAGDGSTRFQQSGIPYLVAPDGLARRVDQIALCKTITGSLSFPLVTEGPELEYYRLPLLCGVDPALEENIAHQESEYMSSKSQNHVETLSPYSV